MGSDDDAIADPQIMQGWQAFLKPSDRLWQCPDGHHFFHAIHPEWVGEAIVSFWKSLPCGSEEIHEAFKSK